MPRSLRLVPEGGRAVRGVRCMRWSHLLRRRALLAARHLSYTVGAERNYASSGSHDGLGFRVGAELRCSNAGLGSERERVMAGYAGV